MKKRDFKAIYMLEKIAQDVPAIKSARIASAIFINNRLISIGTNQNKTCPMQAKYARNEHCGALIHSEINCIKNALRRVDVDDLRHATMYIARMKYLNSDESCSQMEWGLCKPCKGCQMAIRAFEIKRVVYTTDSQQLEEFC